jgi:hypothetical protein
MVEVICVNDKNKPLEIPKRKWVVEGNTYHVTFTCVAFTDIEMTKRTLAFSLAEIELGENEHPYEYFNSKRFGITAENLLLLQELIKDCNKTDFSIDELMKETELIKPKQLQEVDEDLI